MQAHATFKHLDSLAQYKTEGKEEKHFKFYVSLRNREHFGANLKLKVITELINSTGAKT
jgi:hypothetical protein